MSLREIVRWPDARLSASCAPVDALTPEIAALADDMLATMYDAPGRGLAAPQIGEMLRLFVMDVAWKDGPREPRVFLNPEIIAQSTEHVTRPEGCLSIPGLSVDVTRPATVTMVWTDLEGEGRQEDFSGFAAACVQHELDHLNGIVTLDRVDAGTRAALLEQYTEATQ